MATSQGDAAHNATAPGPRRWERGVERDARHVGHSAAPDVRGVGHFWTKINNDWIMNLSGLLAYNLLMSVFPILLVLLAVAGFVLNSISPGSFATMERGIGAAIPGGATLLKGVTAHLAKSAGLVLVIGFVTSIVAGSRLFITLENCFGIVFRLRGRDVIHQNLMAIGMLLLYMVLIPIVVLASIVPTIIDHLLFPSGASGIVRLIVQLVGIAVGMVIAAVLFGVIYIVVPNRPVHWGEVWRGTLVAAVLFVIYELVFPIYESHFLSTSNYGSVAGFAVVILVFFYYLGFILLVGAEVNSWASGQRQTAGDITALLHEVQAHNTTRGVAGPTAGTVQEDLQSGAGSEAMSTPARAVAHERIDHHTDIKPPQYAEAGQHDAGPPAARPQSPASLERTEQVEQDVHHGNAAASQRIADQPPDDDHAGDDDEHVRGDDGGGPSGGAPVQGSSPQTNTPHARNATDERRLTRTPLVAAAARVATTIDWVARRVSSRRATT